MSETQTNRVYKLIDNLTDTISWAELAKELDKYAAQSSDSAESCGGETIEMKDLMKSIAEKHSPTQGGK